MKQVPNLISCIRIACSVALLFTQVFSVAFFILYILCGISDVLDGYIARRTGTQSRLGATLDSIADFLFIGILILLFIPVFHWSMWMMIWLVIVATVRFISLGVGFHKFHALSFLHTYANKVTGFAIFLAPVLYHFLGLAMAAGIILMVANLSALEDLLINLTSKKLDRNIRCIIDLLEIKSK